MKNSLITFSLIAVMTCMASNHLYAGEDTLNVSHSYSDGFKNALYGAVAAGAAYSFSFWLPSTMAIINRYGAGTAMHTTHIPRLCLDVATIAACVIAIYDLNTKNNLE